MDNQLDIAWEKEFNYKKFLVKPRGFYSVHSQFKAKAKSRK